MIAETELGAAGGDRLQEMLAESLAAMERNAWCPQRPEAHAAWLREQEAEARRQVMYREQELRRLTERTTPAVAKMLMEGAVEETETVQAAMAWARGKVRGLMLRGGVGAGKSVAAGYAVKNGTWRGSTSWHRPAEFASGFLHSYDDKAPKLGTGLVVIDDVGRETRADFEEALCAFIDDTDTRFILTTNLTRDQFRERYDARLVDRLNDQAAAITVKGASRRKQTGGF